MRILFFCLIFVFSNVFGAFAAPPPVQAYAQLPAVYDAALSPNGEKLAVILENDGKYIVRVFNISDPSDKAVRATGLPDGALVKSVKWANNDRQRRPR